MIKAILFDLGDVLLKSKLNGTLMEDTTKEVAKTFGVDYDTFETIRKEYHQDLKIGRILFSDFSKVLKKKLNLQVSTDKIIKVWDKCYLKISVPNQALFSVTKKLKKHYKIGLISNIYDLTVKTDRRRGLFNIFEACILSCEVGLVKPQKEIEHHFKSFLKEAMKIERSPSTSFSAQRKLKILFTGLDSTGKTSFLLSVDTKYSKLIGVKPTLGA